MKSLRRPIKPALLASIALLCVPVPGYAQSLLLSAEDFVLLGGTGVTVGGAGPNIYSNGNVGSAASISGFPPAEVVNGQTILGGPIVGQALIDLGSARDKLNALAVDPANNLTGQDLGGMTLAPGVYKYNVAAEITLAGTKILTLDAQFKNNVTWVINIGTTLTTAAGAQVKFINLGTNGGADNGLFWNAGDSITFGAANVVAGNYLAANNITFGTTIPADGAGSGRALAHAIVSFAGQATMDVLGGPGNGDMTGGLALDGNGDLVSSGYVLLSANGVYTQGGSNVILRPGNVYNTPGVVIDGNSTDGVDGDLEPVPSRLTVFQTIATLSGTNTYTGGTFVDAGTLTTGSDNLPTGGNVSLIDSNETGTFGALIFSQSTDGTHSGVISGGGSVTKEDTGALTLTGANTYTGGTFVNGGSLIASSASLPVNGTVALDNDSSLAFDQASDGSFGGVISGDGSVTKDGASVLTFTAVNTHTGGTTVDAGTLTVSGAGTLGSTTGALAVNEGTLDLGGTSQTVGAVTLNGGTIDNGTLNGTSYTSTGGTIGAIITGEGVVFTNTSGVTTLTGANTYNGGTVINGGSIVTHSASLPSAQNMTLGADGRLVLDQPVDTNFNGTVTGTGTIEKQGAGALTMTNDTTAAIDIEAGSFVLTDTTVGTTNVAAGTFLRGNGTILGNLFNAGTVSPGFSPGTIIVAGNYTQAPGGTLVMEFASAVLFDQLIIAGTATLDGTLQIDTLNGYNPAGETFVILTAGLGVSGTFATVNGTAAVTATVTYNANDVSVEFVQTPFVIFAGTPNQTAVAEAALLAPAVTTALNLVPDAAEMPAALNAISPQGYEIWSDIAFARATALADRFARNNVPASEDGVVYFDASRRRGDVRGDLDVSESKYTSDSGLVGVNTIVAPNLVAGVLFNYEDTEAGLGSAGSETEIKSYLLGARAAWTSGDWFVHGLVAYGFDEYDSTRNIAFTGTNAVAKSETDGRQWLADLVVGHHIEAGIVTLSPFGGVLVGGWKADGFTETGAGGLNATVGDQSARSLQSQLGAELAVDFMVGAVGLRPHVRAAWLHEFSNDSRSMDAAFGGVAFAVDTRKPERDSARLSAGLDARISPRTTLYVDVSAQTGDRVRVTSEWRGGVSIGF